MSDTRKTTKPNVPNLRFPGFEGEWEEYTMGEITELFSRRNKNRVDYPMFSVTNARGFVNQQEQFEDREMKGEDIAAYKIVSPGEFAYNPARINVGSIARYNGDKDCMISSLYVCFKAKKELVDSQLLLHILKSPKMVYSYRVNGEGGVRIYLFYPNFARIRVKLPCLEEQRKIAPFLDLIEDRIQIQNKVIEDLKKLKTAFCEKMYDKSNPNTRLADIIEQQSIRNKAGEDLKVLSVSNRYGFVEQSEQFEDRTVASEDTSNYKIVALNDFAYNPARINVGSIARLKNFENGIVSPMYICFRCKGSVLPEFLEPFFSTKYFSLEMGKRLEGSVRMCLSFEGLCNIPINIPSYEEQIETAKKVNALSDKLRLEESYSILLSAQKEYILSQMFI